MAEFYRDERPVSGGGGGGGSWGGSGGGSWGGSGGGSWGGGGGGGDSSDEQEFGWFLIQGSMQTSYPQIFTNGDSFIQLAPSGHILADSSGCLDIEIYCQIQGSSSGSHKECILLAFVIDKSPSNVDYNAMLENLAIPNGSARIRAKWQAGHYDYSKIHTVRFRIGDHITPWVKLALGSYIDVFRLAVRNGQLDIQSARSM